MRNHATRFMTRIIKQALIFVFSTFWRDKNATLITCFKGIVGSYRSLNGNARIPCLFLCTYRPVCHQLEILAISHNASIYSVNSSDISFSAISLLTSHLGFYYYTSIFGLIFHRIHIIHICESTGSHCQKKWKAENCWNSLYLPMFRLAH